MERRCPDPRACTPDLGNVGWVYDGDEHVPAVDLQSVIMMGFNPGAGRGATGGNISRSEKVWRTKCRNLTAGFSTKPVFAELIYDLSSTEGELRERAGDLRPIFANASIINREIVAYHKPNIVFQAGLRAIDEADYHTWYGLIPSGKERITRPEHPHQELLRHYETGDGMVWIAFRHFTGCWGFSNKDRDRIRCYAAKILAEKGREPRPLPSATPA